MKKTLICLFAVLASVMFTACNNDDDHENKYEVTMAINNRAFNGDDVVFSQGTAKVEINYTNMFIKFTADYKDGNGQTHSITTPDMKLYSNKNTVYTFNNIASNTYTGIDQLTGYIDLATGMLWYTFDDGVSPVVSTSQLQYAYTTTTITNPDNDNHVSHDQSAYVFALDAKGESCIMQIYNFIPNITGSVQASEIQYKGLAVTLTTTGYHITASEVESSYKGFYTITDLDVLIDYNGHVMTGSFKCNDLDFDISGRLFPNVGGPNGIEP